MDISRQTIDAEITLVQLNGRLDALAGQELRDTFQDLLDNEQLKIIVDFEQVPFIDSSGVTALLSGLRTAREKDGQIVLCGAQSQAQIVFRLTGLDKIFPLHPTAQNARQSLT